MDGNPKLPDREMVTLAEVAPVARVCTKTVLRRVRAGTWPAPAPRGGTCGSRYTWPRHVIAAFLGLEAAVQTVGPQ